MKEPKVSVVIPTYKRANLLRRAIASVMTQTYMSPHLISPIYKSISECPLSTHYYQA